MYLLYSLLSIFLTIYSYVLVDPNITLINNSQWASFREFMVQLGYYNRPVSTILFLIVIGLLFFFQIQIKKAKKIPNPFKLALFIGIPLIISYPFLSRDFFSYMFDAKIVTFYHQNPYFHRPLDFVNDPWLRFMHWTHRTYPYGPTFLPITIIPSFLSFGKLIVSFLLFKITWVLFYFSTVWFTQKNHKHFSLFFATSPLVIIEGLVNSHNDLISIALTIIGIIFLFKRKKITSYILLLSSVGIKYFTLPYLLLKEKNRKINLFVLWSLILPLAYIGLTQEFQSWYLLNLIPLLLVFDKKENILSVLSCFALLSYYPYLAIGDWGNLQVIAVKHSILGVGVIATFLYFLIKRSRLTPSSV